MFRARRYRAFLVCTAVFVFSFFYFGRTPDWAPEVFNSPPSPVDHEYVPPDLSGQEVAATPPHGFVPEPAQGRGGRGGDVGKTNPEQKGTPPEGEDVNTWNEIGFGPQGQGRFEVTLPESKRPEPHWKKHAEHFPVAEGETIQLPTGTAEKLPKLQASFHEESPPEKLQRLQRLAAVKEAFEHAWSGYKSSAMGHDELQPVKGGARDPFNGWGATLVDALDSLWIMGMQDEFAAAVEQVAHIDFTTSDRKDIPLFETTIRYLGGLLGAYDVSGQQYAVLLDKAVELAEILIGAFDTPNRMPLTFYYWAPDYVSQPHRAGVHVVLAELGSLSLEFTRLAQLTKQHKYYDAIARITNELEKMQPTTKIPGLWPLQIDASGCKKASSKATSEFDLDEEEEGVPAPSPAPVPFPNTGPPTDIESYMRLGERDDGASADQHTDGPTATTPDGNNQIRSRSPSEKDCQEGLISSPGSVDRFGLAGRADSTYEYLPKEYLLLGGLNDQYRTMYQTAMDVTREHLLFRPMVPDDRDLRFLATAIIHRTAKPGMPDVEYRYEGTHLGCFAGAMFALGAKTFGLDDDLKTATQLTEGCLWAYESTRTGIMPETFQLLPCADPHSCAWNQTRYHRALDPSEEGRLRRANHIQEQRLKFDEQAQHELETAGIAVPSEAPVIPAPPHDPSKVKRDTRHHDYYHDDGYDDDEAPQPTETPPRSIQPKDGAAGPPPGLPVLSHEEFVAARIRNEHLPTGMVDVISSKYLLRPEAIESVFIMYRLTGDSVWREKGWAMFEAISKHCRTDLAHSAISDVTVETPRFIDEMESFWLAETLKYFYLLYSEPDVLSLDEFVLNTEAHPFKRPS
ncbi:hypothetical protein ASPZODRAFT_61441 [Penicilliopsis zonata CBS 506.65]|uniref:alpha-1,2-Mannosidase n=1 Tax=Penicilliopsis zonata CBS 506.65 TaxID=1073090 RepID=A0A1L9SPL6_9EURO|nr:hypothetical protein ASPZODRAFT_61441 [Penicilliopsis zonata CBS 506.65]OJJ49202.1 hypothetical protein ASPZODRAFT_61441 [Penicilliopsis zonata CBS 506.65]